MAYRCGSLAKRLHHSFSRGVLKVKIDAAERQIATSQEQSKLLLERMEGSRSLEGREGPLSTIYRVLCPNFATTAATAGRFANRLDLMDTICFSDVGATSPKPELSNCRISRRFLVSTGGAFIRGGRATLCSNAARPSTASAAVHGQGTQRISGAKNLTRWTQEVGREKSQSMLMYLMAMVVGVVGFTYASVPLYRRFCQATGYGGTVQRRETVEEKIGRHGSEHPAASRELMVHFNADVADSMPWKFTPCQNQVLFYIDPEFATDPKMDSINSLILSYTFFKVEDEEEDA